MEKKYDPHCLPIRPAGILVKDNGKVGIEGTTIAVGNRENLKKKPPSWNKNKSVWRKSHILRDKPSDTWLI